MAQTHTATYEWLNKEVVPARRSIRRDFTAAIIAGQLSGLIMGVVMMLVYSLFLGKSLLYPLNVIASFVFGDAALRGFPSGVFLVGFALHQVGPALFWSLFFGAAVYFLNIGQRYGLLALGIITGLMSQIVDVQIVLPWAMTGLHGHDIWAEQVPAFWSWAAHIVYGLGLFLFPWVYSRLTQPRRKTP